MGLSLKKVFKGVKKAASVANPLFGAAYDAIGGKSAKDIGKNYVNNNVTGAKAAALGAAGQAALPLLAGGGGAAAGASGAAGAGAAGSAAHAGLGATLGSIAKSPLAPAILDFAGSTLAGIGQGKQAGEDRAESRREFDLGYGLQKHQADVADEDRQRRLAAFESMAPARQQILAMLAQRFGIPASALPGAGASQPAAPPMAAPPMAPVNVPRPPMGPGAARPGAPTPDQLAALRSRLASLFGAQ